MVFLVASRKGLSPTRLVVVDRWKKQEGARWRRNRAEGGGQRAKNGEFCLDTLPPLVVFPGSRKKPYQWGDGILLCRTWERFPHPRSRCCRSRANVQYFLNKLFATVFAWVKRLLPLQMIEDLGTKGLPSVVGIAGIEDACLDNARGTGMAQEGIPEAQETIGSFP